VHLPVAPSCNIRCNFCNRLYDCANESRPAVTRGILEPADVHAYLRALFALRTDISVAGIAGPGAPFCEPKRTLQTLHAVHAAYPRLLLCVSTNGLNAAEHVDELAACGVTHATVTINAVDPVIGRRICARAVFKGRAYSGTDAAVLLLDRQREAVRQFKAHGFVVKINTVIVPGVNDGHVEAVAQEAARLGADLMNCIPMIPLPDTPFSHLTEPDAAQMVRIRALAARHMPQMYHCRRCRADAVGKLCATEAHASIMGQQVGM
jgi:nitrogen fixation protein NifB